ncbi:MAG: hypothetical protein LBC29_05750 [Propionibacteriaceae bacterium]|nr:hypothetical protein [Propionibacteriaceae bacterium]
MRIAIILLITVVVIVGALVLDAHARGDDKRTIDWLVARRRAIWDAPGLTASALTSECEFYRTLIRRHLEFRRIGGVSAVVITLIWSVVVAMFGNEQDMILDCTYTASGSTCHGVSAVPGMNIVVAGLLGVLCGALFSELYRLRRPVGGPRVASLDVREPVENPRILLAARVVAGGSFLAAVALLLWRGEWQLLFSVAFAGVLVLVAELARKAIADRPRPLLTPLSAAADQVMRQTSTTALVWLEMLAATLMASSFVTLISEGLWGWANAGANLGGITLVGLMVPLTMLLSWVPVLIGIVCLVRSGMRPPAGWHQPASAAAAAPVPSTTSNTPLASDVPLPVADTPLASDTPLPVSDTPPLMSPELVP